MSNQKPTSTVSGDRTLSVSQQTNQRIRIPEKMFWKNKKVLRIIT